MWIRDYLPELAAFATVALWSLLLAPLLLRLFGVTIPMNPRKRTNLTWDLRQSMLVGVVTFGLGMSIFGVIYTYLGWKLNGVPSVQPTLNGYGTMFLKWTIGGVMFGLVLRLSNRKESASQPDPKP